VPEVVVITGASAGVGRATARRFAEEGARIGLIARGQERLEAAAREIEELGGQALPLPADVADPDAVEGAAERAERELGPIDIWINDAMATIFAPLWEIEPAEYRRATEVTYLGTVWGTMAALRRMRQRDRGTIVQVGSALAYRAIPLQAPYCGAKAAIRSFTEGLRTELMHEGSSVRLTMVQLPAHNTPQFEWGRTRMPRHPQPVPPIFQHLQQLGNVEQEEMFRTFNMGIGLICVVPADKVKRLRALMERAGEKFCVIGRIVKGDRRVLYA